MMLNLAPVKPVTISEYVAATKAVTNPRLLRVVRYLQDLSHAMYKADVPAGAVLIGTWTATANWSDDSGLCLMHPDPEVRARIALWTELYIQKHWLWHSRCQSNCTACHGEGSSWRMAKNDETGVFVQTYSRDIGP